MTPNPCSPAAGRTALPTGFQRLELDDSLDDTEQVVLDVAAGRRNREALLAWVRLRHVRALAGSPTAGDTALEYVVAGAGSPVAVLINESGSPSRRAANSCLAAPLPPASRVW